MANRLHIYQAATVLFFLCFSVNYLHGADMIDKDTPSEALPLLNSPLSTGWELDFSDEFNVNSQYPNPNKWMVDNSTKSRNKRDGLSINDWWWKPDNVWQADGDLVLRVDKHDYNTMYCGSIKSKDKYLTQYGYFEARIKIAETSKGTHTAFWMTSSGQGSVDGTANDGAEVDIFESAWVDDFTKSVLHIDGYGANHKANTKRYETPGLHNGEYHVWGLHWTKDFLKIYYDGELKVTYSEAKWLIHVPQYLWLSDGASFGIQGDNFTREPDGILTHAYFDYVRVWKEVSETANVDNQEAQKNRVYPNPVGQTLYLDENTPSQLEVYSLDGICLLSGQNVLSIDVSSLNPGAYILKSENQNYKFYKI